MFFVYLFLGLVLYFAALYLALIVVSFLVGTAIAVSPRVWSWLRMRANRVSWLVRKARRKWQLRSEMRSARAALRKALKSDLTWGNDGLAMA